MTRTRWPRASGRTRPSATSDGTLRIAGVSALDLRDTFGTPALRPRRDGGARPRPPGARRLPRRCRAPRHPDPGLLRGQGVPIDRGRPLGDRGGARRRRLHRGGARGRPRGGRGSGTPGFPRQQQERRASSSVPSTRASAPSCSTARSRSSGSRRSPSAAASVRACSCASTAACTPRRTTSSPPRTRTRSSGSRSRTRSARWRAYASFPGLEFVGLHCHIGSQIFGTAGFRESASRTARAARAPPRGRRDPRPQPRRRLRHRLHVGR